MNKKLAWWLYLNGGLFVIGFHFITLFFGRYSTEYTSDIATLAIGVVAICTAVLNAPIMPWVVDKIREDHEQ